MNRSTYVGKSTYKKTEQEFSVSKQADNNYLDQFVMEMKLQSKLWRIFAENVQKDEFKRARYSGLFMLFVPGIISFYFSIYNPYYTFKNVIRYTLFLGSFLGFQFCLKQDLVNLIK